MVWPSREESETRENRLQPLLTDFKPSVSPATEYLVGHYVTDVISFVRYKFRAKHNKDERCKSCNGADHPDHQDAIVSEKLKLLKISSLKAEQKQAVVGVLNTDA